MSINAFDQNVEYLLTSLQWRSLVHSKHSLYGFPQGKSYWLHVQIKFRFPESQHFALGPQGEEAHGLSWSSSCSNKIIHRAR